MAHTHDGPLDLYQVLRTKLTYAEVQSVLRTLREAYPNWNQVHHYRTLTVDQTGKYKEKIEDSLVEKADVRRNADTVLAWLRDKTASMLEFTDFFNRFRSFVNDDLPPSLNTSVMRLPEGEHLPMASSEVLEFLQAIGKITFVVTYSHTHADGNTFPVTSHIGAPFFRFIEEGELTCPDCGDVIDTWAAEPEIRVKLLESTP